MTTDPQQLRTEAEQLLQRAAAIEAHGRCEPIQFKTQHSQSKWQNSFWPVFNDSGLLYRPAPKPVTRPWSKPEDVPGPVCWLRSESDHAFLVLEVHQSGMIIPGRTTQIVWDQVKWWEHSTDRKAWHKCEVTE